MDAGVPPHLHEYFSDYPLLPENRQIGYDELSEYTKSQMRCFNLKLTKDKKLVACLNKKTNYKVHIETLKLALSLGYKCYKLHRIVEYEQETYLKDYVGMLLCWYHCCKRTHVISVCHLSLLFLSR